MKNIWLWLLPVLFIPSLGFGLQTSFGTVEIIDLLMIGFIPALLLSPGIGKPTLRGEIKRIGLLFICWAFVGIMWIYLYYGYDQPWHIILFSVLKLAKFSLYGYVGLSISYRLIDDKTVEKYHFSLMGLGVITGISLAVLSQASKIAPVYKVANMISVCMSIIFVYILVLYLTGYGDSRWKKVAIVSLVIMLVGSSFSGGRGGWVAAIAGLLFVAPKIKIKLRTGAMILVVMLGSLILYYENPAFQLEINNTLFPNQAYLDTYHFGVGGVDDGGRITTWLHEMPKFWQSPVFGAGFFHRGAGSGLWDTGSHNFWLQMFLETGLPGGCIILYLLYRMWVHAKAYRRTDRRISLALQASLVTIFVGGLSGEYFYGSYGLLSALLVYAAVGARRRFAEKVEILNQAAS